MRWKPQDAVAIVTGASSGIGRCLTELLLVRGAQVVAVARRGDRLGEFQQRFGEAVTTVVGDVTDPDLRQRVVDSATTLADGRVDLLVNNAGIGAFGPFAEASEQRLRRVMEVNFFAPAELTRVLIPALRKGRAPVICNIASVLGHRGVPNKSEYCASKFALHGWSDSLRAELGADGIQVTLVSPSTTRSEFFDSVIDSQVKGDVASMGAWSPQQVAEAAFTAICRRRSEVICSVGGKALVYADRIAPTLVNRIVRKSKN